MSHPLTNIITESRHTLQVVVADENCGAHIMRRAKRQGN